MEARSIPQAITMTGQGTIQISVNVCIPISASENYIHILTSSFPIIAEMFTNASGHTINDGEFTATGNSSAFAKTSNFVINGGTFVASSSASHSSTHYQASRNYGAAQGNAPPRTYQRQKGKSETALFTFLLNSHHLSLGYDSRSFSMGKIPFNFIFALS